MGAKYLLYKEDFEKHAESLDSEMPVELELMDQADKLWKRAKMLLLRKPTKESDAIGLLGPFGEPSDEGKYHIKVLEIFEEEE